jgi:hypothetical protein
MQSTASKTMTETYRREHQVTKRSVGETIFLVDARRNAIHKLNPIGAVIWDQLNTPRSIEALVDMLHTAFADISRRVIRRDVRNLIAELLEAELIIQC